METEIFIGLGLVIIIVGILLYINKKTKTPDKYYPVSQSGHLLDDVDLFLLNELFDYKGEDYDPIIDGYACLIARKHSLYMMDMKKGSHDHIGIRRDEMFNRGAYFYDEVCGIDKDLSRMFQKFLKSWKHKRAIDRKRCNCIGISVIYNEKYDLYTATIVFLEIKPAVYLDEIS